MTEADIVEKFCRNVEGVLEPEAVDYVVESLLLLSHCSDVTALLDTL